MIAYREMRNDSLIAHVLVQSHSQTAGHTRGAHPHSVFSDDFNVVGGQSQRNLVLVGQFPWQLAQVLQGN